MLNEKIIFKKKYFGYKHTHQNGTNYKLSMVDCQKYYNNHDQCQ